MKDIYLKDETYDINATVNYHLSIQASLNGFSFCVLDINYQKYIVFFHHTIDKEFPYTEDYAKYLTNLVSEHEILTKQFKSSSFVFTTGKNTIVPENMAEMNDFKKHFEFNQPLDELEELHVNTVNTGNGKTNVLFTVPNYVAIDMLKLQPKMKFYNQSAPLLASALEKAKKEPGKTNTFVAVHSDFFDIAIFEGPRLLLYNNFSYSNENELVYFILNTYKQLSLNQLEDTIHLSGNISKDDIEYEILSQYLNKIKIDKVTDDFTYSYTFNKIQLHQFNNLFYLYNCA